jgi:hypothetical protein
MGGFCAFLLLSSAAFFWAEKQAKAFVEERVLKAGRSLFEAALLAQVTKDGIDSSHAMTLNGTRLRVQTAHLAVSSGASQRSFLAEALQNCQTPNQSEQHKPGQENPPPARLTAPYLLREKGSEGVLFCLRPRHTLSSEEVAAMVRDFAQTGNLSVLGTFHAMYTRVRDDQLAVLSVEILEGFDPGRMFPTDGDAPGSDLTQLPRPEGRRILSATREGQPRVAGYLSPEPPKEAISSYARRARRSGARVSSGPPESSALLLRTENETFLVAAGLVHTEVGDEARSVLTVVSFSD